MVVTPQKCPKTHEIFVGGSWGIEAATCTSIEANKHFGAFWDTLILTADHAQYAEDVDYGQVKVG